MSVLLPKKGQPLPGNTRADWHPADIKAALNRAGYTMASLAENLGFNSGSSLSKALTSSSPSAERHLAAAIGIHPMEIWPSRYNEDGSRKPQGSWLLESSRRSRNAQAKAAGL